MPKTVFIIADTAVETIPFEIIHLGAIKKHAEKKGKKASTIILDSSYHYKAMQKLPDHMKRGRPDILHLCLLSILNSPLVKMNPLDVEILVHTYNKEIIRVNPVTRLPKHYLRFIGLMEKLFQDKIIKSKNESLMEIFNNDPLEKYLSDYKSDSRLLFTVKGKQTKIEKLIEKNNKNDIVFIVGGFSHGSYSPEIEALSNKKISISELSLEAWIVLNRLITFREKMILQ
ncbi:MAG: 16S rRNA methyltransferase [Candidatus Heimdallarchaeota archaeon]